MSQEQPKQEQPNQDQSHHEQLDKSPEVQNLLSCYFKAQEDTGLEKDAIMLCEMIGNEIQSVSLRVAADPMTRYGRINWAR